MKELIEEVFNSFFQETLGGEVVSDKETIQLAIAEAIHRANGGAYEALFLADLKIPFDPAMELLAEKIKADVKLRLDEAESPEFRAEVERLHSAEIKRDFPLHRDPPVNELLSRCDSCLVAPGEFHLDSCTIK